MNPGARQERDLAHPGTWAERDALVAPDDWRLIPRDAHESDELGRLIWLADLRSRLTLRQRMLAVWLMADFTQAECAARMGCSLATVKREIGEMRLALEKS